VGDAGCAVGHGGADVLGGVDIVDDGVGILAVEGVDSFDADAPEVGAESEFFLQGWCRTWLSVRGTLATKFTRS
jgi:hypothetical protein